MTLADAAKTTKWWKKSIAVDAAYYNKDNRLLEELYTSERPATEDTGAVKPFSWQ